MNSTLAAAPAAAELGGVRHPLIRFMKKLSCLFYVFIGGLINTAWAADSVQLDAVFFTKLRMDYAHRKDFSPAWKIEAEHQAAVTAYQAKDYKKALELSERWLAKCPVDTDMHAIGAGASTALGDLKNYTRHLYSLYGLLQSVTQSGDGTAPKTAYKVISVDEEHSLLQEFGAEVAEQSLSGTIDKINCKFPGGATKTVYFDVSIPLKAMQAQMEGKKP